MEHSSNVSENVHIIRVIPSRAENSSIEQNYQNEYQLQEEDPHIKVDVLDDQKKHGSPSQKEVLENDPYTEVVTYVVCEADQQLSDIQKFIPELSQNSNCIQLTGNSHMNSSANDTISQKSNNFQPSRSFTRIIETIEKHQSEENYDLRRKVCNLEREVDLLHEERCKDKKKIKTLLQHQRRSTRRIADLKKCIDTFKRQQHIEHKKSEIFRATAPSLIELLRSQGCKEMGKAIPKEYSPEACEFISTLYSISPCAYRYVRKTFMSLPHEQTIQKSKPKINTELTIDDEEEEDVDELNLTNENVNMQDFTDEEDEDDIS